LAAELVVVTVGGETVTESDVGADEKDVVAPVVVTGTTPYTSVIAIPIRHRLGI
jgi:hypothetical protein